MAALKLSLPRLLPVSAEQFGDVHRADAVVCACDKEGALHVFTRWGRIFLM